VRFANRSWLQPTVLHQDAGELLGPEMSMADTYLLAMRCPVYRQRETHPGFRKELENLVCDDKGKGASGLPARPKVLIRRPGTTTSLPSRRSNVRGGKGWVNRVGTDLVDWQQEEPAGVDGRRQLSGGGTSRMSREAQVRIGERLGVQFPGATRRRLSDFRMHGIAGPHRQRNDN
jgi:hypothetical protein